MNWQMEFEKLPEEMKKATIRQNAAIRRLRKAEQQSELWGRELALARDDHEQANREYGEVSMRWNPTTNEMAPGLEAAPAK